MENKAKDIEEEKRDWEIEKTRVKATKTFEKIVTLNVGGSKYTTALSTLTKYPDSMLGAMFSGRHALVQQEDGSYFIDRDGEVFSHVLSYLRDSNTLLATVPLLSNERRILLKSEACFYQLQELEITLGLMDLHKDFRAFHSKNPNKQQMYVLDYETTLPTGVKGKANLPIYYCIEDVVKAERANVELSQFCNTCFCKTVTFLRCNLAGVSFKNLYFEGPVSFEGYLMQGAIFKSVGGLVTHKVHFTPWQVSQAVFDPELLEALEAKGCIY